MADTPTSPTKKPLFSKSRLVTAIKRRYFVRLHMSLIMSACVAAGLLTTKLLLFSGVTSMLARYSLSIICSYAVFFLGIRAWLWYVAAGVTGNGPSMNIGLPDGSGVVDTVVDTPSVVGDIADVFNGFGGGSSGGGGAVGSFDMAGVAPSASDGTGVADVAEGVAGHALGALDDEGGCLLALVIVLLLALLLSVFGIGIYLVYQGPMILSEAAFQFILAGGLARSAKKNHESGWLDGIFKATRAPFAITLCLAVALAIAVHAYAPEAKKLTDVYTHYKVVHDVYSQPR